MPRGRREATNAKESEACPARLKSGELLSPFRETCSVAFLIVIMDERFGIA